LDLTTIGDAFVVVVVGGLGSIPGASLAALLIAEIKALCIGLGTFDFGGFAFSFSKLTLVVEFLIMAVVLVVRPWGLMGRPQAAGRNSAAVEAPLRPASQQCRMMVVAGFLMMAVLPMLDHLLPYAAVLGQDVLIAVLF